MRVLVLYAHPVEASYQAALHRAVVENLKAAGHEVDDCDLYAERFDPVLSREERINYLDEAICRRPVAEYVDRVLAAEAIVLAFPVWNYGYPAILKGFFDRVFLPGVSFRLQGGRVVPLLHNIKKLGAVVTYGGNRWSALLVGDPPRKAVRRGLRVVIHPLARTRYIALYDMNNNGKEVLKGFLDRVSAEMRAF
jgi:NAD(P)H dehydrogenase (quinone)